MPRHVQIVHNGQRADGSLSVQQVRWREREGTTWGQWNTIGNVETVDTSRFDQHNEINLVQPASLLDPAQPADALATTTIDDVTKLDLTHIDDFEP